MAIGVASFALLAMIGLMPVGLGVLRDSAQQTVNAQILQQVSGTFVVTSFSSRAEFSAFGSTNLYFDEEAQLVAGATGARYRAAVTAATPQLPGVSGRDAQDLALSLKRLDIAISRVDIPNTATNAYSLQISYR